MIVAGVMSGTSLDGIDVAIVDIHGKRIRPLEFASTPYPKAIREALLGISNAMTHTATIARLHFLLGELYADAVKRASRRHKPALIGLHGQTIFHEGSPVDYLGRRVASTLQIGEAAVVAERTGVHTISNFRERDIAAGGQGAPLVPYVDYLLFRHARRGRVALNVGGIANITLIPAGAKPEDTIAFDTGPGNMVIDALVAHHTDGRQRYDRNGSIARRGTVHDRLLDAMMSDPYLNRKPPKTTGREQFGQQFVTGLLVTGVALPDLVATATEFTVRSIARAIPKGMRELIVSGGGVHNRQIMRRLAELLPGIEVASSADFGVDPDAKEALAFAVLAYEFVHGRSCNLPSATGARRSVMLGKSSPA
jgi:anhydro-N-acetylmuramic acid kinase